MSRLSNFGVAIALVAGSFSAVGAESELRQPKKNELAAVTKAIKDEVKDPDSVKLRRVMVATDGGVTLFCGEVNAKNAYGGYVGFKPFLAFMLVKGSMPVGATVEGLDGGSGATVAVLRCQKMGYEAQG